MKRVFIAVLALVGVSLLAWGVLYLLYGEHLKRRVSDAVYNAYYDYDPRSYRYKLNGPVGFDFEARCNPAAMEDRRYVIDGGKRRVPAECAERVVHEFFRNLPARTLAGIAELPCSEEKRGCRRTIDYATQATQTGWYPADIDVSGHAFVGHAVLVVRFGGKHYSIPQDYDSYEWLGKASLGFEDQTRDSLHVRTHSRCGESLECLYNPFDMMMNGQPYAGLKGAFVCSDNFDVVRSFVVDPPMQPPGPGESITK